MYDVRVDDKSESKAGYWTWICVSNLGEPLHERARVCIITRLFAVRKLYPKYSLHTQNIRYNYPIHEHASSHRHRPVRYAFIRWQYHSPKIAQFDLVGLWRCWYRRCRRFTCLLTSEPLDSSVVLYSMPFGCVCDHECASRVSYKLELLWTDTPRMV